MTSDLSSKFALLGTSLKELQTLCDREGFPRFAARQMVDWLYAKKVESIDQMTNLSLCARARLAEIAVVGRHAPLLCQTSKDGTKKYLFEVQTPEFSPLTSTPQPKPNSQLSILNSQLSISPAPAHSSPKLGEVPQRGGGVCPTPQLSTLNSQLSTPFVESVYIPDGGRATLCVSSQMGCKMGCRFCVTGQQGFHGNLSAADILNQIISIPETDSLSNIVFMGMGEPMDNLDAVLAATEVLTAPWGLGWSPKRITVSTVGVIPGLKRFLDESQCHVAVSLHNPFADERLDIMPMQKAYPIADVIALLRQYDWSGQRRISFEYTMFRRMNDDTRHAAELVRLLRGLNCRVNLIRFHASPDIPFQTSSPQTMSRFRDYLNAHGITCTIRASRGEDIMAACGLLAGQRHLSADDQ